MFATYISFSALFLIYSPLAISGYYCYGDAARSSIVETISHGPLRMTAEICFLVHLICAFPIVFNPSAQYFEELMKIPSGKYHYDPYYNDKTVMIE